MKIIIFYLLAGILFVGCNSHSRKEQNKEDYDIQITNDSLVIPIDKTTKQPDPAWFFHHTFKGKEYISCLNKHENYEIIIMNLSGQRIYKKVTLKEEGPNGCGRVSGYYMQSLDSIYVTPTFRRKIYLVNSQGKIQKTYDYSDCQNCKTVTPYFSSPSAVMEFKDSRKIRLTQNILGNWQKVDKQELKNTPLLLDYNLKTGKSKKSSMTWPSLNPRIQHSLIVKFTQSPKYNIYSFSGNHNLFLLKEESHLEKKLCKSQYIDEFIPYESLDGMGEIFRWYCRNPYYGDLAYDPYRELYYRFVYPGINISKGDNVKKLNNYKKVFSIMVLNENLEVMCEKMMPENTFKFNSYFVSKDGLYLFENHIENPAFDEDHFRFRKIKITK